MPNEKDKNRINLIKRVISYQNITDKIFDELTSSEWDFDGTPALLNTEDIAHVLTLYLDKEITKQDIEKWANFLECRDDVHAHESIANILFELANPDIEGELTAERAKSILLKL